MMSETSRCKVVVQALQREADDVVSVTLARTDGALPAWEPGAHVRIRLPGGLDRAYSLCNRASQQGVYALAVKKEERSRGGSAAVHALRPGDVLEMAGPFNLFPVHWQERHLVLVAGGIGITPIFAMAQEAARRGHSFELHYFARARASAAFVDDLDHGPLSDRVHLHLGLDAAQVRAALEARLGALQADEGVYVCGPRPLIDLTRALAQPHAAPGAVHWESFGVDDAPVAPAEGDAPFEIRVTGHEAPIPVPVGKTALQALLDAGIDVPHACREGECGMCVLDVTEGTPDHRDNFLNPEVRAAGNCMAVCVSRSKTPVIVLDF